MNDQLQDKLVEILSAIQEAAKLSGDFAMEQLPEIAQSYVLYGRVTSAVWFVALLGLSVALGLVARWAYRNPWNRSTASWDKGKSRDDSNLLAILVAGAFSVAFGISSLLALNLLVWFAPKVWLLKEIAGMLK